MLFSIFKIQNYFLKNKNFLSKKRNLKKFDAEFPFFVNMARQKMRKFYLNDWTIQFDNAQRRAGACFFDKKVLSFSTKFLRNANNEDIIDTVLHEIAHAIVGPGQGHNLIWKKKAIEIGCSGKIYHDLEFSKPKWIKFCSNGCWETKCFRKTKKLICKFCRSSVLYRINQ